MYYVDTYASPLGDILLASTHNRLAGVWFEGQRYAPSLSVCTPRTLPVLDATKTWLDRYFEGIDPGSIPPIWLVASPFRLAVWALLQEIPYGEVRTYKQLADVLARRMGKPHMSAQAVGGAVGHNPISILIPCHRVIGTDGSLVGYAGGMERKRRLLEEERKSLGKEALF